jgi:prepilin-type N-terminal cleavage/methylation domain-containing protein
MDDLFSRVARQPRRGDQGGFTLIELLVVMAVMAVLASIVIFNVAGVANRGRSSACATDLKSIQTASDAFYGDSATGLYPIGALPGGAAPGVLNPADIADTYIHTTTPQVEANTGAVTLDANGTAGAANC